MDGSLEWNGIVDTPSICNRSTRLYTIYTLVILPSIVKLAKMDNSFVYLLGALHTIG